MISNKKIKLLETWKTDIFAEFGIAEIMKISKKRTKPWVFNALKQLTKNKLLLSKRKGNLYIYSLNLNNPFLIQTLQYLEAQNSLNFSKLGIIMDTIKKITIKNYCLLVFGSYAENKQTKISDLDVCFLIESKQVEKKIKPYFNEVKLNHPVSIDEHYITFNDFVKMLLREEENLGKQIFRKQKLFYNADIYYQLIREAHKNGFRP
jgi:predicted nucleotidyltransferase